MPTRRACTIDRQPIATTARVGRRRLTIPRFVVRGADGGPLLSITAGQHGRELNGIEACRRLLERLRGRPLWGTVQVLPVVNPPAVAAASQTVPGEQQNPNRVWPGDPDGTLTERIAAAVAPHVAGSDYLIDLHGWSNWTVGTTLVSRADDNAGIELASAFGMSCVYCSSDGFHEGNLKTFVGAGGTIALGAELTPQWRLDERSVRTGLRGLLNVLKHLGMIAGRPTVPSRQWLYHYHTPRRAVLADGPGLYVQDAAPGCQVRRGQRLGRLYDLDGLTMRQEVRAPIAGVLVNIGPCHDGVECNIVPAGAMLAEVWKAKALRRPRQRR